MSLLGSDGAEAELDDLSVEFARSAPAVGFEPSREAFGDVVALSGVDANAEDLIVVSHALPV